MSQPVPCGIRDVDLNAPLPALVLEGDEQSLLAVFWQDDVPVGRRLFLRAELPVSAAAMPALAAAACAPAVLLLDTPAPGNADLEVSVVVCTRDRPEPLRRCMAALAKCDPAPDEIIVIDNAANPGGLEDVLAAFPAVRLVHEPRAGLSFARNNGLTKAKGAVVAYTDDDVAVTPNWISAIRAAFSDPKVGSVTGPVLPARLRSDAEFAFEIDIGGLAPSLLPKVFDEGFLASGPLKAPHVWEIGAGANFAIRKEVLADIGPFDERLGAGAAGCSEDSEFWYRLLGAGWLCVYRPEVVVHHDHRGTSADFGDQMRAYMRGHVAALCIQFSESRRIGNLSRIILGLPKYYVGWGVIRVAAWLGFGWLEPWGRTARATRFAQMRGAVEGVAYFWRHRAQQKFSKTETDE
ncbi:glycosyltransferase [bacterium]|nr:glycosyltransferase [bacterium]